MKYTDLIMILFIVIAGTSFVMLLVQMDDKPFEPDYICKMQDKVTIHCSPK